MIVTADVITFQRARDAMRVLWRPSRAFSSAPDFARTLVTGRGEEIYPPWRRYDTRLIAPGARRDGWGLPDPRRILVLATWPGLDAGAFRGRRRARELWRGVFEPVHTHGSLDGGDPLRPAGRTAWHGSRGAILTYGRARGNVVAFMRQNNRVVEEVREAPALLTAFNLLNVTGGVAFSTFSFWDDLGMAIDFAYRRSPEHHAAIRGWQQGRYGGALYFARLALLRSEGTICGRDPFAGAALPSTTGSAQTVGA